MSFRLWLCTSLVACTSEKAQLRPVPHISLTLSAATISAGETATLAWQSDTPGDFLVTAQAGTGPALVLARGQTVAHAAQSTIAAASALSDGVNALTVSVLAAGAPIGIESVNLTVGGGSSGGSTGGTTSGVVTIGGTVSGLSTAPLTPLLLSNNGGDAIQVGKDGSFAFPTPIAAGASYAVSVAKPPLCPLYACTVTGGSGTANEDVTTVSVACAATGLGVPPRLFFTDLVSGPNAGGDGGNGAYVTIYGLGFGPAAGTVTIGGQPVLIKQWGATGATARGLETITIQLGPNVSGAAPPIDQPLVVTTAAGIASNALDFAVSSVGHIYFVKGGAVSNGGGASSSDPFNDLAATRSLTSFGDVVYLSGLFNSKDPSAADCGSNVFVDTAGIFCLADATKTAGGSGLGNTASGASGLPIAYVGLPGAPATFANPTASTGDIVVIADHMVIAGLIVNGTSQSNCINTQGSDIRIVGNVMHDSCLNIVQGSSHSQVLGNLDSGGAFGGEYTFAVQANFSQNSIDTEFGWNDIRGNNNSCITVATDGDTGDRVVQTSIHDNWLSPGGGNGDAIATSMYYATDFGFYDLDIYDNVITDARSCIALDNANCQAPNGSDCVVHVWSNTCGYNAGDAGASVPGEPLLTVESLNGNWLDFDDNLFFLLPSSAAGFNAFVDTHPLGTVNGYLHPTPTLPGEASFAGNFYGSTNAMNGPSWDSSAPTGNPLFRNAVADDYTLVAFSPPLDAGAIVPVLNDFRGVPRHQGKGYDIGAYEYCPGLDP